MSNFLLTPAGTSNKPAADDHSGCFGRNVVNGGVQNQFKMLQEASAGRLA